MSFISKRERVFVEYGPAAELPARQEGKLKAYASCTDARAWSHFDSDKTEHLVDIIKKDNELCQGKFVPTKAIVDTLTCAKNNEIRRLKRKIDELENLMGAYDKLELTCEQKCELANAHAVIKAAYKDLTEMTLDFDALNLDISNFTEGPDSDYFETGKSGGDEESSRSARSMSCGSRKIAKSHGDDWLTNKASKSNQVELACSCDASTSCQDPRIEEMRENIITKDAKLSAMKNTLAVMENDVCEPYCIYAHIYTALEKIFGTLCQNSKYRLYLDLLASGRDTRCIDIKGRILFKLKILEKFSQALVAPCSQHMKEAIDAKNRDFDIMHVETKFTMSSSDSPKPVLDSKRAQLVADLLENDEMKNILSKDNVIPGTFVDASETDDLLIDNYSIDTENLNRLKNLQADYDDLVNCYENLKQEKDEMRMKCNKYDELEKELQTLREQLREYNSLWNEKEHYRRRSEDVDTLKEQYYVLTEETSNLETKLKAEMEINQIKCDTIDELRMENINLEKKINDLTIAFEKEKNQLQCRLKEKECTVMCQDQQIRSLSVQIDRILEQEPAGISESTLRDIALMDEIESLRDQIKNLKEALISSEEEKQLLQDEFEEKLKLVSDLRLELEDKRGVLEKTLQRNDYLEKYTENFRDEIQRLVEENKQLSQEINEKTVAVENLINVINNKSQEVSKLMNQVEHNRREHESLFKQLQETRAMYDGDLKELEQEKDKALSSLQLAQQESQELLGKVKRYENYDDLKDILMNTIEENKRLQTVLAARESNNELLQDELKRLRDINGHAFDNINQLQEEKHHYKSSFELTKKESEILEQKLTQFEGLREQLHQMSESQEKLIDEKNRLESELRNKANELEDAISSVHMTRKESEDLLQKIQNSENLKEDFIQLSREYQKLVNEKQFLQKELMDRNNDLDSLLQVLNKTKDENELLLQKSRHNDTLGKELIDLKLAYQTLVAEKEVLQSDFDNKTMEINNLYNTLENKIEENRDLSDKIKTLQHHTLETKNSLINLQNENTAAESALESARKESKELMDKLKRYDNLSNDCNLLKNTLDLMKQEKDILQKKLEKQLQKLTRIEEENKELNNQSQNLIAHNEDLEKALITARNELIDNATTPSPVADIMKEIEEMKKDKITNQKKIMDLYDKLDKSENIISNMTEEIMTRDDKIAYLQNHINALQDEVRMLHNSLAQVVDTGEQIKDHSYQKIDQSLNKMEAHHSKATHNMKIEIAKLQNVKATLEDKLDSTTRKSEESFREKHKYVSQVIHLQNEREIIVTDIKQLEITAVGDSSLTPDNCNLDEIINSLEKVRNVLDEKISKSANLEQTLLKVQTSSQLLLTKADEAKKIVEVEKQKIINEKEEAVAEKMILEKQLLDLKAKLEQQCLNDEKVIRDLEAEMYNQELIIDDIKKNTNIYTAKLEEEMNSLQELYQNSIAKINELQEKNKIISEENNKNLDVIDKINEQLQQKSKEVAMLQKSLEELKNKPKTELGIQTGTSINSENVAIQTEKYADSESNIIETIIDDIKTIDDIPESYTMNKKKKSQHSKGTDIFEKLKPQPINEVQILTANIEPTFDFVRNSYLDYKMKRLSPGKLEQYSLSIDDDTTDSVNVAESTNNYSLSIKDSSDQKGKNIQLFDIYSNKQPLHTNSSKMIDNVQTEFSTSGSGKRYSNGKETKSGNEKDLFLIYQDSESSHTDKNYYDSNVTRNQFKKRDTNKGVADAPYQHYDEKTKLDIKIPRVPKANRSLGSISDLETKSIDSYTKESIYTSPKEKSKRFNSDAVHQINDAKIADVPEKSRNIASNDKNKGKQIIFETLRHAQKENGHYRLSSRRYSKRSRSEEAIGAMRSEESYTVPKPKQSESFTMNGNSPGSKSVADQGVMVNIDGSDYYENKIDQLTNALQNVERDYKKKIEVIKVQYDNNIKDIINDHNEGVKSIQCLHEETLHDIIKVHENETENLRSMSIEALRKAERLEKENRLLKTRLHGDSEDSSVRVSSPELRKRKSRCRGERMVLTKTDVEAFTVKPKLRSQGPCTCSLDLTISDTLRNMFQQVDVEQRKMAEHAYLKYIANKISNGNIDALDAQELSFLHLKVCRTWKNKLSKEEALQKKIDSLETELLHKQRHAQQHMADLDRKVAEERRRLQEVREAVVCRVLLEPEHYGDRNCESPPPPPPTVVEHAEKDSTCNPCRCGMELGERRSAGDLVPAMPATLKPRRSKNETSRATLAKLDNEERRERKLLDETPTRLRRAHDRPPPRAHKK